MEIHYCCNSKAENAAVKKFKHIYFQLIFFPAYINADRKLHAEDCDEDITQCMESGFKAVEAVEVIEAAEVPDDWDESFGECNNW